MKTKPTAVLKTYSVSDFWQTDRLIIICYPPGMRGFAMHRLITLSDGVLELRQMSNSDVMWPDGSAHGQNRDFRDYKGGHWGKWKQEHLFNGPLTDNQIAYLKEEILSSVDVIDMMDIAGDQHICWTSHITVQNLRCIWPNAKYVVPIYPNGDKVWFTDYVCKNLLQATYWQDDPRRHAYTNRWPDRNPDSWTKIDLDLIEQNNSLPTSIDRIRYLRKLRRFIKQRHITDYTQTNVFHVDGHKLWDTETGRNELDNLLLRLSCGPSTDEAEQFRRTYISAQLDRTERKR